MKSLFRVVGYLFIGVVVLVGIAIFNQIQTLQTQGNQSASGIVETFEFFFFGAIALAVAGGIGWLIAHPSTVWRWFKWIRWW